MKGRIIKRKGSNNYTIVIQTGLDPVSGKRKQQWITAGTSKREAERKLAELVHELDSGIYIKMGKMTVADYLCDWLENYARQKLSPRSFERYADIVKNKFIPEFGRIQLNRLMPEHIQKHYSNMLQSG